MQLVHILITAILVHLSVCVQHNFLSHVSVLTPVHSYSHGVGGVIHTDGGRIHRRSYDNRMQNYGYNNPEGSGNGYPRYKPLIPFTYEDRARSNSRSPEYQRQYQPRQPTIDTYFGAKLRSIPLLPASPYHVNSPNPESQWPEGLYLPPTVPLRGEINLLPNNNHYHYYGNSGNDFDPFAKGSEIKEKLTDLLERDYRLMYFNEIPHHSDYGMHHLRTDYKPHKLREYD